MVSLHNMKEIREMIRELMVEMYNEGTIYFSSRTEANLIINRIVYKIDPNNIPDLEIIKQLIEKEVR